MESPFQESDRLVGRNGKQSSQGDEVRALCLGDDSICPSHCGKWFSISVQ